MLFCGSAVSFTGVIDLIGCVDMEELREALRYYIKHPWTFLAELIGLLSIFVLGYVFLLLGYAVGLT